MHRVFPCNIDNYLSKNSEKHVPRESVKFVFLTSCIVLLLFLQYVNLFLYDGFTFFLENGLHQIQEMELSKLMVNNNVVFQIN